MLGPSPIPRHFIPGICPTGVEGSSHLEVVAQLTQLSFCTCQPVKCQETPAVLGVFIFHGEHRSLSLVTRALLVLLHAHT